MDNLQNEWMNECAFQIYSCTVEVEAVVEPWEKLMF